MTTIQIHSATDLRIAFTRLESGITRALLLFNGVPVAQQLTGPPFVSDVMHDVQITLHPMPIDSPEESFWIGDASGYYIDGGFLYHRCGWNVDVKGEYMGNILVGPMREHRKNGCICRNCKNPAHAPKGCYEDD